MGLGSEYVDGSGVGGKGDGGFVRARSGRAKDDEAGSGDVAMTKDLHRVGIRGDFGGDPSFALGLLNVKSICGEKFYPDRPKREAVGRFRDEYYVIHIC